VPYHAYCYSQGLKGVKTFILNNYPLNGVSGNFSAITAFIAIIISLIIIPGTVKYLAIIPSVPVIARLLSYILSKTGENTPTSSASRAKPSGKWEMNRLQTGIALAISVV